MEKQKTKRKKVSIIIPCRDVTEAYYCADKCTELKYTDYEVIILPDTDPGFRYAEADVIPTGKCLPSKKRDIGISQSKGEIIAFIDADAYPEYDWLDKCVDRLEMGDNCGVCGAGIIPPNSNMGQKAADKIFQYMPFNYRVTIKEGRYIDDYPTFNLIMWKDDVVGAGGFNCQYLTGEDTRLCQKVCENTGKKIWYDPELYLYHYRRDLFLPFLKQVATYGKHRGYFFKKYPETSRRLIYLLPVMGVSICFFFLLWALLWSF